MTLKPIAHPQRVRSPREAAALFRALGAARVSLRGFHTNDLERASVLVEAAEPGKESTISFVGGRPHTEWLDALEALATSGAFSYLDVRTANGSLRVWPGLRTWVDYTADKAAVEAVLGAPIPMGQSAPGDLAVRYEEGNGRRQTLVETKDVRTSFFLYRALAGDAFDRGFVTGVGAEGKAPLLRLLGTLGATVDVVLDLAPEAAGALAEQCGDATHDWQAEGVLLDLPAGRVHGFLRTPSVGADARDAWLARVDAALATSR